MAQIMLGVAGMLYLGTPFLSVRSAMATLDYYGVSEAQTQGLMTRIFLTSLAWISPMLIAAFIAFWGLIKGNRIGRLLTISVFTWVAFALISDLVFPDELWRLSNYNHVMPIWIDVPVKLAFAIVYLALIYRLGYGMPAMKYFSRHLLTPPFEPPPPPTFDDR